MKTLLSVAVATLTLMTSGAHAFAHDDGPSSFSSGRTAYAGAGWSGFRQPSDPRLGPGFGTFGAGWEASYGSSFAPGGGFSNRYRGTNCGSGRQPGLLPWSPGYREIYVPGPCYPIGHQVVCQPGRYIRVLDPWGTPRGW
jgi:hypothetical protein